MRNSVGRRDTLKLAGAAAALGAGLGMVLKAQDALAQPSPGPVPLTKPLAPTAAKLVIGPEVQGKIEPLQKLAVPKGYVQIKWLSAAGQFLWAANMPEEIAKLVLGAPAGQVQLKFFRPETAGAPLATQVFGEGLIQLVPSTGRR
jgi:hypothetical protein